jgi:hypothetical protein
MLMYFHERVRELVLWKTWVPKTTGRVGLLLLFVAGTQP